MKKAIFCVMLALLLACAGCGAGGNANADESTQSQAVGPRNAEEWITMLSSELPFDDTMTLVPEKAKDIYGIFDEDRYTGDCSLYISTMATPEEIAVFRADKALSTDDLVARAKYRIESQKAAYGSYAPLELPKLDSAVIETVGDYVIVCVCADNERAAKLIENAF